jgi:hypothetical protein
MHTELGKVGPYHEPRYDYRKMVAELGFEGHIAMAEAVV